MCSSSVALRFRAGLGFFATCKQQWISMDFAQTCQHGETGNAKLRLHSGYTSITVTIGQHLYSLGTACTCQFVLII